MVEQVRNLVSYYFYNNSSFNLMFIILVEVQHEALRLAIVIVCGNTNINQNSLNEYFIKNDIFDSLIEVFVLFEFIIIFFFLEGNI
jgi:hypothetical protein